MDGLGGYYAKWNKSVNSLSSIIEKDIILYNITYMLNQKKKKKKHHKLVNTTKNKQTYR